MAKAPSPHDLPKRIELRGGQTACHGHGAADGEREYAIIRWRMSTLSFGRKHI